MPDAHETDSTQPDRVLTISPNAARRIVEIKEIEGKPELQLRVTVSGGGCSGFQYGFSLDDQVNDDDRVFEGGGVSVVVDEASLDLLAGSEVDFVEELGGAYFSMRNPNASSVCGCGTSFAV